MYPRPLTGLVLITCGLSAFAYHCIRWTTSGTTLDLDLTSLGIDLPPSIPLPPIIGFISFASGTPLLISGRPKPL